MKYMFIYFGICEGWIKMTKVSWGPKKKKIPTEFEQKFSGIVEQ